MDQFLTSEDARVLGSLVEKQVTTPDNYPLSMNALVNACNQSSNRHPVVSYDENIVLAAITRLRRASLVRGIQRIDSRVTKYEHTAADVLDVTANELALLCVLMLRGPNTVGELRTRTERLAQFDGLADVETTLNALIEREQNPLVARLPRRPGQKEVRYTHLLSGEASADSGDESSGVAETATTPTGAQSATAAESNHADDRVAMLEKTVTALQNELADLRVQFAEFRKQFE